jgi:1,4-alpha-glucan branching enzyme
VAAERAGDGLDVYGVYKTGAPGKDVAFFTRDTETSEQVWSSEGYPGDPWYMEFHKKRDPGGLRYWRVTDRHSGLGDKMVYEPQKAAGRVEEHARHFARLLEDRLRGYRKRTGRTGVLTLLFDAELFGHWWFEGIDWLGALVSALDPNYVTIERASTALNSVNPRGAVSLPEGSWGEGGRHLLWHNKETAWTWQRLYEAERDMVRAVKEAGDDATTGRLLRQMARELFLAQSSDWQFLISTGTAGDYGESRFLGHYGAWKELYDMLGRYRKSGTLGDTEKQALSAIERKDALFDDVNPEWFEERKKDGL